MHGQAFDVFGGSYGAINSVDRTTVPLHQSAADGEPSTQLSAGAVQRADDSSGRSFGRGSGHAIQRMRAAAAMEEEGPMAVEF